MTNQHLIHLPDLGLYARVTSRRRYDNHIRLRWTAISPVPPNVPDTGVLKLHPWDSVACVRRSDVALLLAGAGLDTDLPLPSPDGCRWCGVEQRGHATTWAAVIGYHRWTDPGDELRKARMLARRARTTA